MTANWMFARKNANQKASTTADLNILHSPASQKCANVISVVFDDWCLGNVLVVEDADGTERCDSDVVVFDGEGTCCAFDFCLPSFELPVQQSTGQIS